MSNTFTKKRTLGLLTAFSPEVFKGDYFTQIIGSITAALAETPYDLRIIMSKNNDYKNPDFKLLDQHDIDGLFFLTWRIHTRYIKEALNEKKIPVVVINDPSPDLRASIVYCDNKAGVHLALRHLLNRGYQKIGMLHAPDDASLDAKERYDLLRSLLEKYNLTFSPSHYRKCDYFFEEDGYLKMMDMIQSEENLPRAIFCVTDEIAIGAIRALKESWIRCPEEVAIIGYDGILRGKYIEPTLTTISQPLEKMGTEMVRIMLKDHIEKGSLASIQKMISPELVIRRSC